MTVPQNQQLSDADLELLSAYIDNRLTADERATLEQRLRDEPALRGTLDDLRGTVTLLRGLPPLTPPRSFTLDPAAFAPRPSPLFGWLRLGATLASVLLALTFAVDLVGRGGGLTGSAPAAAPAPAGLSQPQRSALTLTEAPAAAAPAAENAAPTAAPAAPLIAPAAPAATAAPAAGGAAAVPTSAPAATAAPAAAAQATPEATDKTRQSADSTSAEAATSAPALKSSGPTAGYLAPSPAAPAATPAAGYVPPAAPIAPSGSQSPDTLTHQQPLDSTQVAPAAPAIRPIRLVEIGLASLALLLGVGALWTRRRR
ncbi:MAG TPA: hypothetical protein VGJ87_21960 [Roseiflexaceae bacterium]